MGLLFSRIWAYFSHQERKLLLLGLDNSGKTTILYRIVTKEVVQTSPTLGSNVEQVTYNKMHFVMWDLGGQENLRSSWANYYRDTEFVILVVDSSDTDRVPLVREELWKLLSHADLERAAILVLANKQDIAGSLSAAALSEQLKLTAIKKHQWTIFPCCALTGSGLEEALTWMTQNAGKQVPS